jgi:hypothetical protein
VLTRVDPHAADIANKRSRKPRTEEEAPGARALKEEEKKRSKKQAAEDEANGKVHLLRCCAEFAAEARARACSLLTTALVVRKFVEGRVLRLLCVCLCAEEVAGC